VFGEWQSFYILVGSAAATLVGLIFVAMSVGSSLITAKDLPALRVAVSPTIVQFLSVLATSAVVLVPILSATLLGILLVVVGLISCGLTVAGVPVLRRAHPNVHAWVWYFVVPGLGYILFIGSGIGLLLHVGQAATGLGLATLLLLVGGVRNAWDLVIFRLLHQGALPRREGSDAPDPGGSAGTPERQAEATPRAPQGSRVESEPRQSLALSPRQQAEVTRIIQEGGMNPRDFTWALQPSRYALIGPLVSALVHTRTGCFFRFEFSKEAPGSNRMSVFVPGKGAREVAKPAASWADQLEQVRGWLTHVAQ
jgi:hypothetical protein